MLLKRFSGYFSILGLLISISLFNKAYAQEPWIIEGNTGTNATKNFLGTTDEEDLVIRTNNRERIRVNHRGRVGIGTDSPRQLLHVEIVDHLTDSVSYAERLSHVTSGILSEGFGIGLEFQIGSTSSGTDLTLGTIESVFTAAQAGGILRFKTTGAGDTSPTTRMTITEDGNVGINIDDPSSRFVIRNDSFGQRPLMSVIAGDETPFNMSSTGSVTIDPVGAGVALRVKASSSLPNSNITPVPFYVSAADDVNAIYVTKDGDVGIGTAGEGITDKLRILGPENNGSRASVRIISGTNQQTMLLDGNEIDALNAGLFLNNNSAENVVLVAGGGNVGIGTTNPTDKLHIRGLENDGNIASVKIVSGSNQQTMLLDGNEIDALSTGLFLNHNSNEKVVLATGGGNVGIGTADPQSRLHIQGSTDTDILVTDGEFSRMRLVATDPANDVTLTVQARGSNNTNRAEIGTVSNHDVTLFANGTVRLVIARDGNVCIGNC